MQKAERAGFLLALVVGILASFLVGTHFHAPVKNEVIDLKDTVRTIAVVNMDQGIVEAQNVVNYGTSLLRFPSQYFYSTSLEQARTGIENHQFAAYVIIPSDFSEGVWSINTAPRKMVLEYAVNPNLQESIAVDVIADMKAFEMTLNTDISYMYLYAILDEFHSGQKSAAVIMENDRKDMENLSSIDVASLIAPLDFVELLPVEEYPEDMDLTEYYQVIENIMQEMDDTYWDYFRVAESRLEDVREEQEPVWESVKEFRQIVSELSILETESGDLVYKDMKEQLLDSLEQLDDALGEENSYLQTRIKWLQQRDTVASASDMEHPNIWLDVIYQTSEQHREQYIEALRAWRESFDYEKLASMSNTTPSNATPSDATPSDATSSDATSSDADSSIATPSEPEPDKPEPDETPGNWLAVRDQQVYLAVSNQSYERLQEELSELILDEETREEMEKRIRSYFMDPDYIAQVIASASNAYPVGVGTEAGVYVQEFLSEVPDYSETLDDILNQVEKEMKDYADEQLRYLKQTTAIPIHLYSDLFDDELVVEIEHQEEYLQAELEKGTDVVEEDFNRFLEKLEDYEPVPMSDEDEFDSIREGLRANLAILEKSVNGEMDENRDYIGKLEESQDTDIEKLQESLEAAHTVTSQSVQEVLENAKSERQKLNRQNQNLLTDFTQKLPYTKNGSVAATGAYDFIVNPVVAQEKKIPANTLKALIRSSGMTSEKITIILLAAAAVSLLLHNGWLRRKNRQLKEKVRDETLR